MAMSSGAIEGVLKLLERQLWLVTAADGDRQGGLVATWVAQVSLQNDPLIMAVSLGASHFTRELVDASHAFCLHLISQRHTSLALRFATSSGRSTKKLAGIPWQPARTGAPRIEDVVAWLDCRVFARFSTGDRVYYWAEVTDGDRVSDERPLTDAAWFATLDQADLSQLASRRQSDIRWQQPRFDQWRGDLPEMLSLVRHDDDAKSHPRS